VRFPPRWILVCLVPLLSNPASVSALTVGAERSAVIEELGKPTSDAALGNREILTYPKKVRIELVDGRVERAEGILLDDGKPAASPASPARPTAPVPAHASAPAPTKPATPPTASVALKPKPKLPASPIVPAEPDLDNESGAGRNPVAALSKHIEEEEAQRSHAADADQKGLISHGIGIFAAGLAIHLLLTCVALKLAFKLWELDAFLTGILAIAGIDLAIRVAMELLAPLTGGLTHFPSLQGGVAGVVMIFTIRRFCFNKDWFAAVRAAAIVKTAVGLFAMFGTMALLRLVFHV
jgi:hypothetical protein